MNTDQMLLSVLMESGYVMKFDILIDRLFQYQNFKVNHILAREQKVSN